MEPPCSVSEQATLLPAKEAPSEVQLHTTGTPGLSASTKPLLSFPSPASVFPGFSFQPLWSQEMRFVCPNSGSPFWQQTKAAPPAFVSPSRPTLSQPPETCPQAAGAAFSLAWSPKCSLESASRCCQTLASLCTRVKQKYGDGVVEEKQRVTLLLCQAERQRAPQELCPSPW